MTKNKNTQNKNTVESSNIKAKKSVHIGDINYILPGGVATENQIKTTPNKIIIILLGLIFLAIAIAIWLGYEKYFNFDSTETKGEDTVIQTPNTPGRSDIATEELISRPDRSLKTDYAKSDEPVDKPPVVNNNASNVKKKVSPQNLYLEKMSIPGAAKVKAFKIGKYEVTVGQYLSYCKKYGKPFPYEKVDTTLQNFPMRFVNWREANEYCKSLGGRLPTYEEWKCFASFSVAPDMIIDDFKKLEFSWNMENSQKRVHKVGEKKGLNGKEVYDVFGNVEEWILDGPDDNFKYSIGGHYNSPIPKIDLNAEPSINRATDRSNLIGFRVLYE